MALAIQQKGWLRYFWAKIEFQESDTQSAVAAIPAATRPEKIKHTIVFGSRW